MWVIHPHNEKEWKLLQNEKKHSLDLLKARKLLNNIAEYTEKVIFSDIYLVDILIFYKKKHLPFTPTGFPKKNCVTILKNKFRIKFRKFSICWEQSFFILAITDGLTYYAASLPSNAELTYGLFKRKLKLKVSPPFSHACQYHFFDISNSNLKLDTFTPLGLASLDLLDIWTRLIFKWHS